MAKGLKGNGYAGVQKEKILYVRDKKKRIRNKGVSPQVSNSNQKLKNRIFDFKVKTMTYGLAIFISPFFEDKPRFSIFLIGLYLFTLGRSIEKEDYL